MIPAYTPLHKFQVRVTHSLGLFTVYEIEAKDYHDAEILAKNRFLNEFCGGTLVTVFRGEETKHSLDAFTINKYQHAK